MRKEEKHGKSRYLVERQTLQQKTLTLTLNLTLTLTLTT